MCLTSENIPKILDLALKTFENEKNVDKSMRTEPK